MTETNTAQTPLAYRGGQPVVGLPRDGYTIGREHAHDGWRHLTEREVEEIDNPDVSTGPLDDRP